VRVCCVPLDQVRVDLQSRTNAVTQTKHAVVVGHRTALYTADGRPIRTCAHNEDAAAVGLNAGIGRLIEQDSVVLNVPIPREPDVTESAAVTSTQVSADPVVVEVVEVEASTNAHTTCSCRCTSKQLITRGEVANDRVVMDVYVNVLAERQLSIN